VTDGTETDSIITDTTERIFRDLADLQTINAAQDLNWKSDLWNGLEASGLTLAWVSDEYGGGGAELQDGFDILRVAGRNACAIALSETLLAGWLLGEARISCPSGPMAVAPLRADDVVELASNKTLSGTVRGVPFAADAEHLAVLANSSTGLQVALVSAADCSITDGKSISGDPRNDVTLNGIQAVAIAAAPEGFSVDNLLMMGAASRASMMSGALEAILDISVNYAKERVAFERTISKFQAVQHNLARLAGETASALAAAGSAADTVQTEPTFNDNVFLEIASAKIRVGEAANEGAAIAHQTHGAIGFTAEHILHRYTNRLWAWRDEFGSEAIWAVRLGEHVAAQGADGLWPMLAVR
jgi:acyl-CoA dehydrogenase